MAAFPSLILSWMRHKISHVCVICFWFMMLWGIMTEGHHREALLFVSVLNPCCTCSMFKLSDSSGGTATKQQICLMFFLFPKGCLCLRCLNWRRSCQNWKQNFVITSSWTRSCFNSSLSAAYVMPTAVRHIFMLQTSLLWQEESDETDTSRKYAHTIFCSVA